MAEGYKRTYYKFENCEKKGRNFFKLHEDMPIEYVCSWFCNKTLSEIYRLLFFLTYTEYKKEFEFNRSIQKTIELIAFQRKFEFLTRIQLKLRTAESKSGAMKFRLVNILDWTKFFAQYENTTFGQILDELFSCTTLSTFL